jgi:hypothetical protein
MKPLDPLQTRFHQHRHRHPGLFWEDVVPLLLLHLDTINAMEDSGGEPDIVVLNDQWVLVDMVKETPKGRRSLCYDKAARISRKKFPPASSVEEMAALIGIQIVDETMYHQLQAVESFDEKTSSWILTPKELRDKGGALFGDTRYGRVFVYHNGADSYYESRGFRGYIKLN